MSEKRTLKETRERKGYTQQGLAQLAGVSSSSVSKAERGVPTSRLLIGKLCRVLGVDPDSLEGVNYAA